MKLKLLLIQHGKCSACASKRAAKHCERCFNTRLEPGVLEAITALDLGTKLEENKKLVFENISEDDRENPPQGSYFSHVIERKNKLEGLYKELLRTSAGTPQETEVIQRLIQQVIG
ncbi:MAG TPA: hypothetical protein VK738_14900 [Terriglobales bacterium]|nr:hypothetical protein [Terriglobales bacterium]